MIRYGIIGSEEYIHKKRIDEFIDGIRANKGVAVQFVVSSNSAVGVRAESYCRIAGIPYVSIKEENSFLSDAKTITLCDVVIAYWNEKDDLIESIKMASNNGKPVFVLTDGKEKEYYIYESGYIDLLHEDGKGDRWQGHAT